MTNNERVNLNTQLSREIRGGIQHSWDAFEALTTSHSVQAFCAMESRYDDARLDVDDPFSLITFEPAQNDFDAHQAASIISRAYGRTNTFTQGIVEAYCLRKRMPVPEVDDAEAITDIVGSILKSGIAKVDECIALSEQLDDESLHLNEQHQIEHLAVSILMTAAQLASSQFYVKSEHNTAETDAPQGEIDATIDEALQSACQKVINGEKFFIPKGAHSPESILASGMNILRVLYHQGSDRGFQAAIFNSVILSKLLPDLHPDHSRNQEYVFARQKAAYDALASTLNPLIGTTFKYPGPLALNKLFLARDKRKQPDDDTRYKEFIRLILKITNTHATRQLVDAVAQGEIKYSEIMAAAMRLKEQPLITRAKEIAELPEETLDWVVLPEDVFGPNGKHHEAYEISQESVTLDFTRVDRLRELGMDWPGAYIARGVPAASKKSGGMKDAYYVLVLPEVIIRPGGERVMVEHAVADSPKANHGLYVFRGEQGMSFQPAITWREVFSQRRGNPVKRLGALCLLHVASLEHNLLNTLTCPAEDIERRRRYLINRREAWRLAKTATTNQG